MTGWKITAWVAVVWLQASSAAAQTPPPEPAPDQAAPSDSKPASGAPTPKKFAVTVATIPAAVVKNRPTQYRITVVPAAGFVLVPQTPFSAHLRSATVELEKTQLSEKDFDDPEAATKSVTTSFTAKNAGEQVIRAKIRFFICEPMVCERYEVKNELKLNVLATASEAPPTPAPQSAPPKRDPAP